MKSTLLRELSEKEPGQVEKRRKSEMGRLLGATGTEKKNTT
jgi:hypothetical protein